MEFRDGDIILSRDGFLFYTLGYCHPRDRVISFLKYVPKKYTSLFRLEWLSYRWLFRGVELLRPKKLFSPKVYSSIVETFEKYFPQYLLYSKYLGKYIVSVPLDYVSKVFIPEEALRRIREKKHRDRLEEKALRLVELLSEESEVPIKFFGIHGSICLGMHNEQSDIDLTVYGSLNYRKVIYTLRRLEREGIVRLLRRNLPETIRGNTGLFEQTRFVVNAVRLHSEISCDEIECKPLGEVVVECIVTDSSESMFRPATYGVTRCKVLSGDSRASGCKQVISMIGLYRGVASKGDTIIAKGMLEECRGDETFYRVFIGSGISEEYIGLVLK